MGLKRWIKHLLLPVTMYTDTAKNMIEEGSVVDGIKNHLSRSIAKIIP